MITEKDVEPLVGKEVVVRCVDGQVITGLTVFDWQPDVDDEVPDAVLLQIPGHKAIMEVRADEVAEISLA